jgi:hypothetical protein
VAKPEFQIEENTHMPMREELYVPEADSLDLARASTIAWHRIFDDPDFNVIGASIALGLLLAFYLALTCPLPDEYFSILPMI